ncbi:MAG: D-aminoacyl-tRNA deacylase [Eubacteriales bacterium]|nr:D-aminoacyl-tRNA deacylase [Eubacteriales bacterium]
MKAVIQRVTKASVSIEEKVVGSIGQGYLVLLGVAQEDTEEDLKKLAKKMLDLRIFQDDQGKTNLSIEDVGGELLIVSQFTLLADCKKGRRPSFVKAGNPQKAEQMYEEFLAECQKRIPVVEHGKFGADMQITLVNDGPFTIVLDSGEL